MTSHRSIRNFNSIQRPERDNNYSATMSALEAKPKHNTPPINIQDFRPGYLKPQSYSAEDISKAIIDLVSRSGETFTERQLRGIEKLKACGGWSLAEPENQDNLKTFFDIFNDVLFNGVLTGYCTVSFYNPWRLMWFANVGAYCRTGYTSQEQHQRFKIERPSRNINVVERAHIDRGKERSAVYRISVYQDRLVHQMLHAVFQVYTCYCSGCSEKNRNYVLAGSHNEPWLAAAHAIEQADKIVLPDDHDDDDGNNDEDGEDNKNDEQKRGIKLRTIPGLDLEKNKAVVFSVHNGAKMPPEPELRRLGVDFMKVWGSMKARRKLEAQKHREEQQQRQLMKANQCLRDYWTVESDAEFYEEPDWRYFREIYY